MEYIDDDGKWIKENGISVLIEPSAKWIEKNSKNIDEIKIDSKNKIINKLKELDLIVPRVVEDIIKQSNFKIDVKTLDIIKQKEELRKQLL